MITLESHKDKLFGRNHEARLKLVFEWVKAGHLNTAEFIKFIDHISDIPSETGPGIWELWAGGRCPVEYATLVIYRMRDGDIEFTKRQAGTLDWVHTGDRSDWEITAYMVVQK